MKKTIEGKVADTILQTPEEIRVGEKTYKVAPPSIATLILASEAISLLPSKKLDSENIVSEALSVAKDCRALGDFLAIIILGAKHIDEAAETPAPKRKWWRKSASLPPVKTRKEALAAELLENLSPGEFHNLAVLLLQQMQLGDFFGITTFLTEINMTRPTKVVTEATVSGQ